MLSVPQFGQLLLRLSLASCLGILLTEYFPLELAPPRRVFEWPMVLGFIRWSVYSKYVPIYITAPTASGGLAFLYSAFTVSISLGESNFAESMFFYALSISWRWCLTAISLPLCKRSKKKPSAWEREQILICFLPPQSTAAGMLLPFPSYVTFAKYSTQSSCMIAL